MLERFSLPTSVLDERTRAALEALFVTVLWSSSYVLIVIGLEEIAPLTFAGLRYGLATLVLIPLWLRTGGHRAVATRPRRDLVFLAALGVFLYAVTQGAQFFALLYLNAATVSLVLTATPVLVAVAGAAALSERPSTRQWIGIALLLVGAAAYLGPEATASSRAVGLAVMGVGLVANAGGAVIGRQLNRDGTLSPLSITTVSMGFGSALLLATGVAVRGFPRLSLEGWTIVAWLAVVNTAFAFTLWNRSLRTLTAVESSVINNTMIVQVAAVGWLFLDQTLSGLEIASLCVVAVGAFVVQVAGRGR